MWFDMFLLTFNFIINKTDDAFSAEYLQRMHDLSLNISRKAAIELKWGCLMFDDILCEPALKKYIWHKGESVEKKIIHPDS